MKVVIVDDEDLARERMRRLLENLEGVQVVGEAANGKEALFAAEASTPDLVLMDIRMPVMDGLEAARHLAVWENSPAVIFTTAYSDHALEAFETHAVDYLLKPIRKARLHEALKNASRLTRIQISALDEGKKGRQNLCARIRGNLQLIAVSEVFFFQADQKYVTVRHQGGSTLIEDSLKELEQEFSDRFIRIHRNALVAVEYLQGLEKNSAGHISVSIDGVEDRLEVSRRHVAEVRKRLKVL